MAAVYKSLSKGNKKDESSAAPSNGVKKNKQRVLILSSRGVTFRHRHLMSDLASLMPHSRREAKFESKKNLVELVEIAEILGCNNIMFFEARNHQDLWLWLSKPPNNCTMKFHVQNIHTMEELNFTGNCLKGSRPILSFDAAFEAQPHLRLAKELLSHCFNPPQGTRKSKPFIDHVMSFSIADGRIWVRNYQINEEEASKIQTDDDAKNTELQLVEIGPRFTLKPTVCTEASFGGPVIYKSSDFVHPRQVRSELRKQQALKHNARAEQTQDRLARKSELGLRTESTHQKDGLDTKMLFA